MPNEPEEDRVDDEERTRRHNRLLVVVGLLCFIVGLPLVSLLDGVVLSVIGLSLETVAAVCVISFVYRLAGDQHDPDSEDQLADEEDWLGGDQGELAGNLLEPSSNGDGEHGKH
jgi:hypothetical protein